MMAMGIKLIGNKEEHHFSMFYLVSKRLIYRTHIASEIITYTYLGIFAKNGATAIKLIPTTYLRKKLEMGGGRNLKTKLYRTYQRYT